MVQHIARNRLSMVVMVLSLMAAVGWEPTYSASGDQEKLNNNFKNLKYRLIGPAAGGRVSRATGVPNDPLIYYAATASGGVWKSRDGGIHWKPIFDDQPTSSIGSIAVAPSNPSVIYVGSGEGNIRGNVAAGNGIYKSTDAGKTWQHVWKQEGQIGQMIVHPHNSDIAFAAVLGHAFGPNPERGIYRTTDGGKTWQRVLAKNAETGACDVCFDPSNPNLLFAGLWQARRSPWTFRSGGPDGGLYMSRDGGDTWKQLGPDGIAKGLPEGIWGRIGIAVAASDGRRIYALIEAKKGGLYRSDDGGDSWKLINGRNYLQFRPWYFSTITVDPKNPDVVYCPSLNLLKSIDGGQTFKQIKSTRHGDHHDMWIDPQHPQRMIGSSDGGVEVSYNGGETWLTPHLPITQFYHIGVDNHVPYRVFGSMQDLGTAGGPSNSLSRDGIGLGDWYEVGGGEAGFTVADPTDPNIIYAGEYGGYISRFDLRTRQARNISIYPISIDDRGAGEMRYRFQWTAPILISPHDSKVIYHAGNVLFRSVDSGEHWTPISPDLTRNDKSKQKYSGGPLTGDNSGAEFYDTIFAIAESPRQKGLLWAGSDDGLVHVSQDGGKTWTNVTANIPGLPEWGTVTCIEASAFDASTAYLVVDAHRLDNMRPYLFKTNDLGKTWQSLTGPLATPSTAAEGSPATANGLRPDVYLHVVREDPKRKGLLYLGTEKGVMYSPDDGARWLSLQCNLPTVAVHDLIVKDNDLVVGTHGRSIWILDDLTPIRLFDAAIAEQDVHLFPAQPTIRYRYHGNLAGEGIGTNPSAGAIVHYFLKKKPAGEIALEIFDKQGQLIRQLNSKAKPVIAEDDPDAPDRPPQRTVLPVEPGIQRIIWDLHYAGPLDIPNAEMEGDTDLGPLVPPGVYTLRLTVEGKTVSTTVEVLPDPRASITTTDWTAHLQMTLALRDDISRLSAMVRQIQSLKKQLATCQELWKDLPRTDHILSKATQLSTQLNALEVKFYNPRPKNAADVQIQPKGAKLYSQMVALFDWLKNSDARPTQGMREVYAEFQKDLQQLGTELKTLLIGDLTRLNVLVKEQNMPYIIDPVERDKMKNDKGQATGKDR